MVLAREPGRERTASGLHQVGALKSEALAIAIKSFYSSDLGKAWGKGGGGGGIVIMSIMMMVMQCRLYSWCFIKLWKNFYKM